MKFDGTDDPSSPIPGWWGHILVHALEGSQHSHQELYTLLNSVISLLEMGYKERIHREGKISIAGLLIIMETMEII